MRIHLMSLLVNDQEKALRFYTGVLGFIKKTDVPVGEHRWLTVVSAEEQSGVELLLEPMGFAPARDYQKALYEAGIPLVAFHVANVQQEYDRLTRAGVRFTMKPTQMGPATLAVFDDTCGNNVQIMQV